MENLFSTSIAVNGQNVQYKVIFENEKYAFLPEVDDEKFPAFSFVREADEWHEQGLLSTALKDQAVEALEKYLLQQH